jgi:hypothetical protein
MYWPAHHFIDEPAFTSGLDLIRQLGIRLERIEEPSLETQGNLVSLYGAAWLGSTVKLLLTRSREKQVLTEGGWFVVFQGRGRYRVPLEAAILRVLSFTRCTNACFPEEYAYIGSGRWEVDRCRSFATDLLREIQMNSTPTLTAPDGCIHVRRAFRNLIDTYSGPTVVRGVEFQYFSVRPRKLSPERIARLNGLLVSHGLSPLARSKWTAPFSHME